MVGPGFSDGGCRVPIFAGWSLCLCLYYYCTESLGCVSPHMTVESAFHPNNQQGCLESSWGDGDQDPTCDPSWILSFSDPVAPFPSQIDMRCLGSCSCTISNALLSISAYPILVSFKILSSAISSMEPSLISSA